MTPLRLIFMGSPDFAMPTLAALLDAGHDVVCVYAQPPRPAGRGHHEHLAPVHAFAADHGLPVRTPTTLRDEEAQREFLALAADAGVVAAYGLILPPAVVHGPRLGCFNVHASLLPRWRGAAPIQRAILAGDTETGVTIMQVDDGLDTGPTVLAGRVPITQETTAADLHDTLAALGAKLMVEALIGIAGEALVPVPQPAEGATYAAKLDRDEGRLDWTRTAEELDRTVRALNPWPGVWFNHAGQRIKVLAAEIDGQTGEPGEVLDDQMTVACGEGAFRPLVVQRSGKAPSQTDAFLRGYALPSGTRLA